MESPTTPTSNNNSMPIYSITTTNKFSTLADQQEETRTINNDTIPNNLSTSNNTRTNHENNQPSPPEKSFTTETIILCDSNGKKLDTKLLCPGSSCSYIKCPTMAKAIGIMEQYSFTNPKTFIIHCGTNDIEKVSNEEFCQKISTMLTTTQQKYPNSRIIISSLLPRSDNLLSKLPILNQRLEKICSPMAKVLLVKHDNLFASRNILYDRKHLNDKGFRLFAKNLKGAFFGNEIQLQPKARNQKHMKEATRNQQQYNPHHPKLIHLPFHHLNPTYSNSLYNTPIHPTSENGLFQGLPKSHTYPQLRYPMNIPSTQSNNLTASKAPNEWPGNGYTPRNHNTRQKTNDANLPKHFVDLVKLLHGYIS